MQYNDYRFLGFTVLSNGLLAYYPQLKITNSELILIIQLELFAQKGNKFPSNEQMAANTNFSATEIASIIQQLIDKNDLTIDQVTDEKGRIGNYYNLDRLYSKLDNLLEKNVATPKSGEETTNTTSEIDNSPLNQLMRQFEIEFGRYLSPIEREEISAWLNVDHYDPEIIKLALREAVLSQAYSLKYVDRVLLNWQRHNLKTTSEVQKFLQRNR
ncbi:MAG: DnaD domain protein [Lactobacillus apis]|uniref:DnaD domain protein n=1 Tax=Lactobacillus TaxID=1578 RepID=UPI000D6C5FF0|nr:MULTISPECIES: DnaD domain protein [Lactobacillus]AWM73711.1 DNA replication protein DnaD [Lactobacillus apis]MBC6360925.1 DnaD domain protein [Lactobacillus apis]MBH9985421.1 DnaD domain protein [Lactobacillus sp. M0390]MCT6821393.1 DnaD domain protein [Lactobacillus apis]MCT6876574.1 DnaD domain protein [Lactobacillus apis]